MVAVAQQLAQAIVRDGEGATKFITVTVQGGLLAVFDVPRPWLAAAAMNAAAWWTNAAPPRGWGGVCPHLVPGGAPAPLSGRAPRPARADR